MRTMAGDLPDASNLPGRHPQSEEPHGIVLRQTSRGVDRNGFPQSEDRSSGEDRCLTTRSKSRTSTRPERTQRVDRAKYVAMRGALLAVLPSEPPGLKVADAKEALLPRLPDDLFPRGKTAGWWLKGRPTRPRGKRRHQTRAPEAGASLQAWADLNWRRIHTRYVLMRRHLHVGHLHRRNCHLLGSINESLNVSWRKCPAWRSAGRSSRHICAAPPGVGGRTRRSAA